MKKILVTGGTGYIGSHTVVELIAQGYEPIIVDNLYNSTEEVLDGIEAITGVRPAFHKVDCCDTVAMDQVFSAHPGIGAIIHFAAYKAVGESCEKPLEYYRNNLVSLMNILQLMPKHGVKGLVLSSSCTVYGQPDIIPVNEQSPVLPANCPYGNTKQISEEMVRDFIVSGAPIKSVLLRYFNPIGAHPSALIGERPNGVPLNLLPYVTQTAMGIREHLNVFGDDYNTPDGTCLRDYIDVVDLAKAHVLAIGRMLDSESDSLEVFNLGTGRGVSVLELVNTFQEATGQKVNYKIAPRRSGDVEQIYADCTKANEVLGWKAETPLSETLANAWRWQLKISE